MCGSPSRGIWSRFKMRNRAREVKFFHPPVKTFQSRINILPPVGAAGAAAHSHFYPLYLRRFVALIKAH